MAKQKIEGRIEELAAPMAEDLGYELVDVEYVKEGPNWFLRIYLDKKGGISMEDCEAFSRPFSELLDREDPIDTSYYLEVSSPGLDRPLKKDKDFFRYVDEKIEVNLYAPLDGEKRFVGINKGMDEEHNVILEVENKRIKIPKESIGSAKRYFDFNE